ncbi:hypothetical protein NQ315_005710 [Exocentrus adspersus]|uniref:Uncharacterized protein n=1 Tax=Exocentrus adspersus TaxID=1586481 RepID=A0AAV8VI66_9CUCU|nr:hypothetical protein NQ315_005710 [Exocentrus adspersus]
MKVEYILKNKQNLKNIDPRNPHNFLPIKDIYLGTKVEILIAQNHGLKTSDIEAFRLKCLDFYIELAKQIKDRFDFENLIYHLFLVLIQKIALSVLNEEQLNAEWRMLPDIENCKN